MTTLEIEKNEFSSISDKIYFWTATINKWFNLLQSDKNKQLIVDSLKYLSDGKYITIYAFVIMPNHIHIIWKQNKLNGHETPKGSFLKYTAHNLLAYLEVEGKSESYRVERTNKKYEIWQTKSLAIEIFSLEMAKQKLDYIHYNPVKHGHVSRTADWPHSSFRRYVQRGVYPLDWSAGEAVRGLDLR